MSANNNSKSVQTTAGNNGSYVVEVVADCYGKKPHRTPTRR